MTFNSIEKTLSISRFSTYRKAIITHNSEDNGATALELYKWNAEVASRFFFPLHIYEITLRNAVSDAISMRYGKDWPINQVFINSLHYMDKKTLKSALKDNYTGVGKLLPELKFVWFENMLTKRHDGRIWKPYIKDIFPNSPASLTAEEIRLELKNACYIIRKFRNRCGHHEPIFNNLNLPHILPMMFKSVEWRCLPTYQWINQQETVSVLLSTPII